MLSQGVRAKALGLVGLDSVDFRDRLGLEKNAVPEMRVVIVRSLGLSSIWVTLKRAHPAKPSRPMPTAQESLNSLRVILCGR